MVEDDKIFIFVVVRLFYFIYIDVWVGDGI
jgi:hypothetical protein